MDKKSVLLNKTLVIGIVLMFIVAVSPISVSNRVPLGRGDCPIVLTVQEAWELLNDTSNGIQIPIDLRSWDDWNEGFIDTPWPEHPRWYGNGSGLQEFMDMYDGEDVIIYCKGGYRSLLFCYFLCDAGFNGTIYNMEGGITAWIEEGYPIRNNTPPFLSNFYPWNGSTNLPIDIMLMWIGGDPDGDQVTFDVYFGTSSPPPKIVSNQSDTYYDPGILEYYTTYYWQIVAWDMFGASTESPILSFTTETGGNHPPEAPFIDGEKGVVRGVEFDYYFRATDPEGDDVRFHIDWGYETTNITDFYKSGETTTVGHTYWKKGTCIICAYAEDIHGAMGPESTYIPEWRSRAINFNLLERLFIRFPMLEVLLRIMNLLR